MTFKMVHCDEGDALCVSQGFGVRDADQQGSCEAGAGGDGDGVEVVGGEALACARAARTTGTMARRCSRLASSGTTPP